MEFRLFSIAFKNGEIIPDQYSNTPLGKNISPPLNWENPPEQTKCFAIIVEDIDAPIVGIISHWVLYNIPSERRELEEGIPRQEAFADGMLQGRNFYKHNAFMGASPPYGTHRYYFKIYALDAYLKVDPKMTRKKLLKEIESHIIKQTQLMGLYSRKSQ